MASSQSAPQASAVPPHLFHPQYRKTHPNNAFSQWLGNILATTGRYLVQFIYFVCIVACLHASPLVFAGFFVVFDSSLFEGGHFEEGPDMARGAVSGDEGHLAWVVLVSC